MLLGQVKDQLAANPVAIQLPIGAEDKFEGVIDLVQMNAHIWHGEELGAKFSTIEIPEAYKEKAKEYHDKMVEQVADFDDEVMSNYMEGKPSTVAQLKRAIRKGTLAIKMVPCLCGTAFKNKGVQPLLDAVCDYLPSPLEKIIALRR